MDVTAWLDRQGLGEYAEAFAANHIDAHTLRQLTAEDLRELGVASIGHRRRLLAAIAGMADAMPAAPAAALSAEREAIPVAALSAERRPITVLFADLCGYTALSRELPDEQLRNVVGRYLDLANDAVRRQGGTVDKHIGDSVMALFGAPVAHDDDMLRAARAALDLQERMPALSREVGRPLACHVGIAVGEVIVSVSADGAYSAVGEAVNLAARLTSLAPPEAIYVSAAVQRGVATTAELESCGRHEVKGFDEPIGVWRLCGLAASADAAASQGPFVGRATEIAQIAALIDSCRGSGAGGMIYVRGEPGIGKSRLLDEARRLAARQAIACHACQVLDFGAGGQGDPLRRLAESLLGLAHGSPAEARLAAIGSWLEVTPAAGRLSPFLHELVEAPLSPALRGMIHASDEPTRRSSRQEALLSLVGRALVAGPVLLIVEDLHWADDALVQTLVRLADLALDRPLLLAFTTRPENERLREALQAQRSAVPLLGIELAPLRPQDAAAMVGHLAPGIGVDLARYVERAGGNPLFLEQLLRNAVEAAGDLPPSLRGLVVARVDRLAPADRAAIQAASVLGQRFDERALLALLEGRAYDPAGLLQANLLRRDGGELVFAHALIQEAVYRSLLGETRNGLHLAAAAWFADRDALLRASHLDRAAAPGAAEAYRLAAEERLARYRPTEALPLVDRGLAIASAAADRAPLEVLKGDILLDGGRAREALAVYQQGLADAADPRLRSLALLGSAAARRIIDELPAALEDLAAAEALAAAGGWLDILSRCRFTRGNLYFPMGRVEECRAEHAAALDLAERSGNAEAKARALGGLGDAAYAGGRMSEASRFFRDCVAESHAIGLGRVEVSNMPMYSHTLLFDLQIGPSLAVAQQAIALAVTVGQQRAEMIAHHAAVGALLELERYEDCRTHIARTREIVRAIEAMRFEAENLSFLADVEVELGNRTAAGQLLDEAESIARSTGMAFWGPAVLAFKARLCADAGARDELVAECDSLLAGKVLAHNHYLARRHLIELGRELGDPDMMEHHCAALAAFYAATPMPFADFICRRGRVLAAALRGDRRDATVEEARALIARSDDIGARRLGQGLAGALAMLSAP